jgi:quercetin dioxygenase-like cupin family protein
VKIIKPSDVESKEAKNNPFFIGNVSLKFIIGQNDAPDINLGLVTFAPGARNVFHAHSASQILYAVEGEGIVATEKEEFKLKPGMVAYIPAGEKHWHGASKNSSFSHLSILPPNKTTS